MADGCGQLRRPGERQSHVGERSQGHQVDLAGPAQERVDQHIHSVAARRGPTRHRQPDVTHTVLSVYRPGGYQVRHVQGVLYSLVEAHVAGHHRDGLHVDVRVAEGHHQGDGIVGGRVGVYDQAAHLPTYSARMAGRSSRRRHRKRHLTAHLAVPKCSFNWPIRCPTGDPPMKSATAVRLIGGAVSFPFGRSARHVSTTGRKALIGSLPPV